MITELTFPRLLVVRAYHFVTVLVSLCVFQEEDVASLGVEVGLPVFYVPMSEEYTRYVFVEQLRR